MMPRTLFAKLTLALFFLFTVVGVSFLISSLNTAYMYQQEVSQRLNRDLAMYIVDEHVQMKHGEINRQMIESLFHNVMIINPSLELYLLDKDGTIDAHSVSKDKLVRDSISLTPIRQFLSEQDHYPVFGQDPKHLDIDKAFSAAPIVRDGQNFGYIYAILGSEQFDNINEMIQQSYIVRESTIALALSLAFAFIGGMIIVFMLTRRLTRLGHAMESFRNMDHPMERIEFEPVKGDDEISAMLDTFQKMARQIEHQLSQLQETDALRREMVANVSHDLRTPLATIQGYIETLIIKNNELDEQQRLRYLDITKSNSDRLNKLVTELFELAKLDAGELKLHRECFSLAELAHDVMQKFHLRAEQQGLHLDVDIDAEVPFVEADIGLIERVMDNLVENALKHTTAGGEIKMHVTVKDDKVVVEIKDTGRGIAEDELPHIFKRFYKQHDENNTSGAGLGLAIAQRILELHGSRLSVASVQDEGSSFDFALPASS